ncbi:hypothetical protein [Pontibacter cellulosilyticus]|uniref:Uncharacterized protein n=1 Tax=Pontibacter cellulosilyticus TaxID=1720253 RepID=A0A923N7Y1_9BACT|nr:hypothetical protein [Pontibacter cellulosilyticus]MBC5993844.1 hypothetical protein [Pontibacter cellulosilyticus]
MLLLATAPTFAQIKHKSNEEHKQQRKKFLKQADTVEAQYKDTHLNVDAYTFKVGEAGRKRVKKKDERARYQFNEAGEPVKKKRLFNRKKKKKRSN